MHPCLVLRGFNEPPVQGARLPPRVRREVVSGKERRKRTWIRVEDGSQGGSIDCSPQAHLPIAPAGTCSMHRPPRHSWPRPSKGPRPAMTALEQGAEGLGASGEGPQAFSLPEPRGKGPKMPWFWPREPGRSQVLTAFMPLRLEDDPGQPSTIPRSTSNTRRPSKPWLTVTVLLAPVLTPPCLGSSKQITGRRLTHSCHSSASRLSLTHILSVSPLHIPAKNWRNQLVACVYILSCNRPQNPTSEQLGQEHSKRARLCPCCADTEGGESQSPARVLSVALDPSQELSPPIPTGPLTRQVRHCCWDADGEMEAEELARDCSVKTL